MIEHQTCRFDFLDHEVEFEVPAGSTEKDAMDEQMKSDGWREGACPECAFTRGQSLSAEHNADSAREMEVAP